MGSLAAAALLLQAGVEPILQLTCRDRNRIALQSDLLGAAALGIENLLLLRGDDPSAGDQPDAKPVFDIDSAQLERGRRAASATSTPDVGPEGLGRRPSSSSARPMRRSIRRAGWTPKRLKDKIAAGAQFAQTQFCMDANVVRRYAQCLADNGISNFHLLIGLAPLRSARSARWIREKLFGSIIPDTVVERLERAERSRPRGPPASASSWSRS